MALPAGASVERAVPIEVVSPRAGQVLRAGGEVVLQWRDVGTPRSDFEEWEVFLSLDGGSYWALRLTPHLDREVSRFRTTLPPIASRHARFLYRFGDEREEVEVELPGEWTVEPALLPAATGSRHFVARSGEAARPGEPGVVEWIEGPRDGRRWQRFVRDDRRILPTRPELQPGEVHVAASDEASRKDAHGLIDIPSGEAPPLPTPRAGLRKPTHRAVPVARRLAILSRRNE